ncbi:calcium-binding protein [Streptomyces bottropensis]|uniref:calcium-binding protein n=1 Tax=Streptomyces bottropensis TaxID=42235 RepID=UPI0036AB0EFD
MAMSTRRGLQAAAAAAAGAALLVPTGPASAATGAVQASATVVQANDAFIFINAAAGERNRIFINPSGSTVTVIDTGASTSAGVGCTLNSDSSVSCPAGTRTILVVAGDEQDTIAQRTGLRASLDAGPGNDTVHAQDATGRQSIAGGEGRDTLLSGSGADVLVGGLGVDLLSGGAGNDILDNVDQAPGDSAQGGDGSDSCTSDSGDQEIGCES